MPTELNASLRQKGKLGQFREIEILNGREVRITTANRGRKSSYLVSLLAIADKSKIRFHIPWAWFFTAAGLIVVGGIYYVVRQVMDLDLGNIEFAILAIWSVLALGSIVMLITGIGRTRVYFARYSRVPLFFYYVNRPTTREYKQFRQTLEHLQQESRNFWELRTDQQIAGEVKTLRRLADQRVITQTTYESAKTKLFAMSNKKSVTKTP